jgi:hypothetical protein
MDEFIVALKYAKEKKLHRVKIYNFRRRQARLKAYPNSCSINAPDSEQDITSKFISMELSPSNEENMIQLDKLSSSRDVIDGDNKDKLDDDKDKSEGDNQVFYVDDLDTFEECVWFHEKKDDLTLHPYTTVKCFSFAEKLVYFVRHTNISKKHVRQLIGLIQSALPQPNNLPYTYSNLLELLSGNIDCLLFFFLVRH